MPTNEEHGFREAWQNWQGAFLPIPMSAKASEANRKGKG
jgi:hypothetical protein